MTTQAFGPRGNTFNISCNESASVAVKITAEPTPCFTYQFVNEGGNKCYFAYGSDPRISVTIPTPGSPASGVPVLPNEIVIYRLNPNVYITAICESGQTTNLLVTPGEGM